ncbi:MAG: hypothetical protein B7Z10_01695 [Rhodobacterales bacterium 32-66-7]|nr:MAG: hypothetical protein B7Z31_00845 [Rhodobacterales bacterium 12-65-15]OYX26967.1 MAG: hypothetical protein B7Z10_01695 [Rhodobacterales bacterium 32-66-7]
MSAKPKDPFFVGYFKKVPPTLRAFALQTGAAVVGLLVVLAFLGPMGTIDPGAGRYANDLRGGTLTGVIEDLPYPILRVPGAGDTPARAVLLGGQDKVGAQDRVAVGAEVIEVGGVFVRRGDLEMLLISGGGVKPAAPLPGFVPAAVEDLGRWRLTGEICDGKCYGGAMKPGRGLAHKACANLCIIMGLPPVLVMALPVEGSTVVLLADADGGPMPDALLDLTARPIQLEGQLERRDDLMIFRIDEGSVLPM